MILRQRRADDTAFIYDSWRRSFRASNAAGPFPPDVFFTAIQETITRLLARTNVRALVLEDEAADAIVGYVVHEPGWQRWSKRQRLLEEYHVVHYLFVRELARGQGMGRYLVEAAGVRRDMPATAYSFSTPCSRRLLGDAARFIPDAARYSGRQ